MKRILEGVKGNPGNFDFIIFDDITDMLNELENRRKEGSRKIAWYTFLQNLKEI
ncbi:hypothetical protein WIW89_01155 [Stygiolobus sp. CP850M]|uniref:hypothetical protein n=1 Tax=Stygiolobus sp. CP850M TaxID=3133134 RepID=UPI00307D7602